MSRKKAALSPSSASGEMNITDIKAKNTLPQPAPASVCGQIRHYRTLMRMEQKDLALRIGVTANAISNWETGRSRPDLSLIPVICEALDITLYDIFDMKDPTVKYTAAQQMLLESYGRLNKGHRHAVDSLIDALTDAENAESCPDLKRLIYFGKRLAAGIGDPTEPDDNGSFVYVYSSPEADKADCIFTVSGNSMEPEFRNGQDVLVKRGSELNYGEIGAFVVGNETYIKEYREDGLHSLNPEYKTLHFDGDDSVYLIGRVLGVLDKAAYAGSEAVERYKAVHGE